MIFFKDVQWKNLLSTGDQFTKVILDGEELTLIVGKNGGGKSTILDALCLCLYSKPFRDINKPQLVNSINKKNLIVEVNFSIGQDNYFIRRGMKPDIFEIYKNGDLLNQAANARDYQEVLEKQILKMNYKAFCQVDILGTASFTPFMKLTPADRRAVIEDLLDIQVFSKMNIALKEKIQKNATDLRESENAVALIHHKIELQKENEVELEENNKIKIKRLEGDILIAKNQIETSTELVEEYKNSLAPLLVIVESKQKVEKTHREILILNTQLTEKIKGITSDIRFFEVNESCPTCKQTIDTKFKCDHVEEKTKLKEEIESGLEQLRKKLNKETERLKWISETQSQINTLNIQLSTENTKIDSANKEISRYIREIELLKAPKAEKKENKVENFEKELEAADILKYDLIKDRDSLSVCASILKDSGIKARIIKQYIPIINELINKYLSDMDFFVSFELDENFKETIKSRYRDTFSYSSFSEGEKMRINLAILFTWRAISKMRNAASTNLLIMDEVLDSSLDNEGIDDFIEIIKNLTKNTNCFIISHKGDVIDSKFSNVIRFEKKNNYSVIASE